MIEKIAAWCMVVVSLIAGYVLIDNHFLRPKAEAAQSSSLDGKRLDIPEISWPESPAHLVLAISSHCRFCIANASFYKQVTNENLGNAARVVVLSADEPQSLQQFLKANSIRTD